MFCKYCGNEIADNSKFCPKCGNEIHPIRKMSNDNAVQQQKVVDNNEKKIEDVVIVNTRHKSVAKVVLPVILVIIICGVFIVTKVISTKNNNNNAVNNADNKDYFVAEDKDNTLKNDDQKDDEAKSDSNKIVEDMDRGYTNETTVDDVQNNEKSLSQDPDFIRYWPVVEPVFNEEKQIYEYKSKGDDKSRINFLYYKDAEINGISASYGMAITFDGESQKIFEIHYYLTDDEFQKFEKKYGVPDSQDEETKDMRWDSDTSPHIIARYYDDFGTEWEFSEMEKSGKGYIVSLMFD